MKLKSARAGFTLIELLIVVAVIGILAAIAIPQFDNYRRRAYNSAAQSDLANVRYTEETMMAESQDYGAASVASGALVLVGATTTTNNQTVLLSGGVAMGAKVLESAGRNVSFIIVSKHLRGDSAFGTEAESQGMYRRIIAAGVALANADIPAATAGDDFSDPWARAQ